MTRKNIIISTYISLVEPSMRFKLEIEATSEFEEQNGM